MTSQEYIAKILRAKTETIIEMDEKMSRITGKTGVLDKIAKDNEERINKTLNVLGCHDYKAETVFRILITKLQEDDRALYKLFKKPSGTTASGLKTLFDFAINCAKIGELFVLKKEKAKEILIKNPPPNIIKALGHENVQALLSKEDLVEIFAALRFVETNDWMHRVFDYSYNNLTSEDFEKRKVELRVLSGKWLKIAEKFVGKKYHNISHLKELGIIFVIPLKIDSPGETLRLFSLILHYLHELDFYSKLFIGQSASKNFGAGLISLLKGTVLDSRQHQAAMDWLIVQRYLAKDNPKDYRLAIPHVNPEAVHWRKAENDIGNLGREFPDIDLELWSELDWVGGFLKKRNKGEELVSFDIVDNVMALVQKEEKIKYLYHHQEALWNHIFEEYMGSENLEKLMVENFNKGIINIK